MHPFNQYTLEEFGKDREKVNFMMEANAYSKHRIDSTEVLRRTKMLSDILTTRGIRHWIDFGTLLGAVREGGLIEGDSDIDIDILCPGKASPLGGLVNEIRHEAWLEVFHDDHAGMHRACARELAGAPGPVMFEQVEQNCAAARVPYIDFYECRINGRDVMHSLQHFCFRRFFIERTDCISVDGFDLPCPRHASDLLLNRYGKNWTVPLCRSEFQRRERRLIRPMDTQIGILVQHGEGADEHVIAEQMVREAATLFERVRVGSKGTPLNLETIYTEDTDIEHVPFVSHITEATLGKISCRYIAVSETTDKCPFTWDTSLENRVHRL